MNPRMTEVAASVLKKGLVLGVVGSLAAVAVMGSLAVGFVGCNCKKKGAPPPEGAPATAPSAEEYIPPPRPKDPNKKYFAEGTPTRAIQDLDDELDSYVMNPKTPAETRYNEALKKRVLNGTFDIAELCRLSMAQHWGERSSGERTRFIDLMTRLLEKKAVFSKEQGGKKKKGTVYFVSYEGHRFLTPDQSQGFVRTFVNIPSEDLKIELNYKLRSVGGIWKIFDVIVDGASLLDNYRFQFDKIIKKDGYPTLVHRMESKLKELESKSI